jgi:hypothetical protein
LQSDTDVVVNLKKGQRLSSLVDQDAYSYILAEVKVAAQTSRKMLEKYVSARESAPSICGPVPTH